MSGTDFEKLNIILAARDREFAQAMERNQRRVERFTRQSNKQLSTTSKKFDLLGFAAKRAGPLIAALGAAAVLGRLRSTVSTLDDIGKTADRIGLTTDALQELRVVAESAGVEQSALDTAMEKFSKGLGEATLGLGQARIGFAALNLDAAELANMPLDQALGRVADEMVKVEQATQKTAIAQQLFGRGGSGMLNLLREGSVGMSEMRANARALGVVIDEDLVRGAEAAQDKLDMMGRVISANLNSALVELAPLLVGGATAAASFARAFADVAGFVSDVLSPSVELQAAIDNVTLAMGDQISQTAHLNAATAQGNVMTREAALGQLRLAEARRTEYMAAQEQIKNAVLQSSEYQRLGMQIGGLGETLAEARRQMDFNPATATWDNSQILEIERALAAAVYQQSALMSGALGLNGAFSENQQNIDRIRVALQSTSGDMVTFNGSVIEGIDLTGRLAVNLDGGVVLASDLRDAVAGIDFSNPVAGAQALAGQLNVSLNEAMRLMGLLGAAAQAAGDAVIYDPRDPRYDAAAAEAGARAERIAAQMAEIQKNATIVPLIEPVSGASGGVAGGAAGGSVGGAAGLPDVTSIEDFEDAVRQAAEILSSTRAEAFGLSDDLARLNALFENGEIAGEDYEAQLQTIKDTFDEVAAAADRMEAGAVDALVAIFDRSKSAKDAVGALLSEWGKLALQAAFKPVMSGVFDGIAGAIFGGASFAGGGDTGSGARSGGLDGKGGFLAMLHPRESVIDHNLPRGSGGGSGGGASVNINVNLSGAKGNAEVAEIAEKATRQGLEQFERHVLPQSVRRMNRDPRRLG